MISLNHYFRGPVRFSPSLEGNAIKDDTLFLGPRAGPVRDVHSLIHEMAHLVEIDDKRAKVPGWGLTYPTVEIMGREYCEPSGIKGVLREIRVIAIQALISEYVGVIPKVEFFASSLRFLPDYIMIPTSMRYEFIMKRIEKCRRAVTIEEINDEWDHKMFVLGNEPAGTPEITLKLMDVLENFDN